MTPYPLAIRRAIRRLAPCLLIAASLAFTDALVAAPPSVSVVPVRTFSSPGAASVELAGSMIKLGEVENILNPLMNGNPVVATLAGATFTVKFEKPTSLRRLMIPRVGWDDWNVPDRVAISIDGKSVGDFTLTAPRMHPKADFEDVDVIDLGADFRATRIDIEILDTSILKSENRHGTFRLLVPKDARK
jgi:hypothetical protein